jgi:hypothetical protein
MVVSCNSQALGSSNDIISFKNTSNPYQFYLYSGSPPPGGSSNYLTNCMGLKSLNGQFTLSVRSDGNLMLYDHKNKIITWQTYTAKNSDGEVSLEFAYTGQLKLHYTVGGVTTTPWSSSNNSNIQNYSMFLLSDTGILIIYHIIEKKILWSQPTLIDSDETKKASASAVASVAASLACLHAYSDSVAAATDNTTEKQDASFACASAYVNKYVQELGATSADISGITLGTDAAAVYSNIFGTSDATTYASYIGAGAATAYTSLFPASQQAAPASQQAVPAAQVVQAVGTSNVAAGTSNVAAGTSNVAAGTSNVAAGTSNVAAGTSNVAAGTSNVAAGSVAATTTPAPTTPTTTTKSSSGTTTPTTSDNTILLEACGACICVVFCMFVLCMIFIATQQK